MNVEESSGEGEELLHFGHGYACLCPLTWRLYLCDNRMGP